MIRDPCPSLSADHAHTSDPDPYFTFLIYATLSSWCEVGFLIIFRKFQVFSVSGDEPQVLCVCSSMAVDLGFIDKDCHLLESRFFPSKIGGKPAWLNLGNIPTADELTCSVCSSPLYFLCQLYCPLDDKDSAFHRALFVFLCTSKDCFQPNCNSNFLVYRNQLSKRNPYYPDTPPIENLSWRPDITPAKFGTQVCSFCGIRSGNVCSAEPEQCSRLAGILPEYGLSIEPENEPESDTSSEESDGDDVNTTEYETRLSEFRKIASAQG